MAKQIPVGYKAPISIGGYKDAQGNPTTVDAVTNVTVSDPEKAAISSDGNGNLSVEAIAAGQGLQVIFTVDVRLGPDVREVTFYGEFDIPAGEAATATVDFGEPVPV